MSKKKMPAIDIDELRTKTPRGIIGSVQANAAFRKAKVAHTPVASPIEGENMADRKAMRKLINQAGDDIQCVLDRLEDR